ncbi:MAG: class I SAM-dependent methyltransferase [Gaiellaceae bacterium]
MTTNVLPENAEAQRAWDGVLFDRFVKYRHLIVSGLAAHGAAAIRTFPPHRGDRVLDVGCGFGDTALQLAELVGPSGSVVGVDVAPRFIEAAQTDAKAYGDAKTRFEVMDVQASRFDETFDYVFSRFGTMFFASPVAALRNVRAALPPGGRLCMVVWRRKLDNPWMHRAEEVVTPLIEVPEETDEARCGPGPFSMANADTVSQILLSSGFDEIDFRRRDLPYRLGATLAEAIEFNLALGPAAEAVRLAGAEGEAMRGHLSELLRNALAEFETPDGVIANSSVWIVTARAAD